MPNWDSYYNLVYDYTKIMNTHPMAAAIVYVHKQNRGRPTQRSLKLIAVSTY